MLMSAGSNASMGWPVNWCVVICREVAELGTVRQTEACTGRLAAPMDAGVGDLMDWVISAELDTQVLAPLSGGEDIAVEARTSAEDVARFSRSVLTVRLFVCRDCWGRLCELGTLEARLAAIAARTAIDRADSETSTWKGVFSVGILDISDTGGSAEVDGAPGTICQATDDAVAALLLHVVAET